MKMIHEYYMNELEVKRDRLRKAIAWIWWLCMNFNSIQFIRCTYLHSTLHHPRHCQSSDLTQVKHGVWWSWWSRCKFDNIITKSEIENERERESRWIEVPLSKLLAHISSTARWRRIIMMLYNHIIAKPMLSTLPLIF